MNDRDRLRQEVEDFYSRWSGVVRGYLFRVGTPAEIVDEIVTDAFLVIWRQWDKLRNENALAYAVKVARNLRAQRLAGIIRLSEKLVTVVRAEPPAASPEDPALEVIDRLTIERALEALPERHRQVIVLRKVFGFSVAETANILNIPEGTVKSDLHRGLAALHELLSATEEATGR